MKLNDLIGRLESSPKQQAMNFVKEKNIDIDIELPVEISDVFNKLDEKLSQNEFEMFSQKLSELDENLKKMVLYHVYDEIKKINENHQEEISNIVDTLEKGTLQAGTPPFEIKNHYGLLNSYLLMSQYAVSKYDFSDSYPAINYRQKEKLFDSIPFAINALIVAGILPKEDTYHAINFGDPLYPMGLEQNTKEKVTLRKGIKNSSAYFPFKRVNKIHEGDTGNVVFLATNGKKVLYVRGVPNYTPQSVLASKIATLISPKHFSSERLLDNQLIASAKFPNYALSVGDFDRTRKERKELIEDEKFVFPGSGIIDEVTNFVKETDENVENFGFSSTVVAKSHLSKIDFDKCHILTNLEKNDYDQRILTKHKYGIYHGAKHVVNNPQYVAETLYTRMKLCMLSQDLISGLASKAFIESDELDKKSAINELKSRANIALELFIEHSDSKFFLEKNPHLISQCFVELCNYIDPHFEENESEFIKQSIQDRANEVKKTLEKKLGITPLDVQYLTDFKPYYNKFVGEIDSMQDKIRTPNKPLVSVIYVDEAPLSEYDSDSALNSTSEYEKDSPSSQTTPGFLSRNKWKIAGMLTLGIIGLGGGVGVGIALTATGILAPLGAGIIGLTLASVVGLGGGLLAGGAVFGSALGYSEYKHSKNTNSLSQDTDERQVSQDDKKQQHLKRLEGASKTEFAAAIQQTGNNAHIPAVNSDADNAHDSSPQSFIK